MRVPLLAAAALLAAAPESRAQGAAADTLHLEVGSPRVNGGVYRPHSGRVVKLRIAGGRTDTTAVWTNRLVIGDSAGRAVHRWHTAGWSRQPNGARGRYDLWSTFDARTLALLGWHLKTEKGFEVRLGADGRAVRGSRRTPADTTPVPIDTTLPRAGFAAGAADLIPYAVGLREGVVMTLPLWSPPGTNVKTEVWRVTRRTPVEFAGRRVPSWEMEHYRPEDGRLLGRIWFIDEPPYVARWDLFAEDGATERMLSEPVEELSITFLANEGVLLSAGPKKVLIDGLFLKYESGYAVPADSTQAALRQARPPFDAVDLVLVTHRHGDHFHPAPVAAHLRANPRALLLTSQQVIDSLRSGAGADALPAPLERRVAARTLAPGLRRRALVNGIPVELLGLPHGGGRRHRGVEHLGYVVDLGGRRVLHVGDAELSEETLAPFRLDTARIDVALLPYWALTDEETRRVVERWIRPREIVAFHVPEGGAAEVGREVRAAGPAARVFSRPLETLRTPP